MKVKRERRTIEYTFAGYNATVKELDRGKWSFEVRKQGVLIKRGTVGNENSAYNSVEHYIAEDVIIRGQ